MKDKAEGHFSCTPRDRALFEAGIKMGAIYHQFIGMPLSRDGAAEIERAIEKSVMVQPFVEEVHVCISREGIRRSIGLYGYSTLTGDLLDVTVTVVYRGWRVVSRMSHVSELDYPLMYVESVSRGGDKPLSKKGVEG